MSGTRATMSGTRMEAPCIRTGSGGTGTQFRPTGRSCADAGGFGSSGPADPAALAAVADRASVLGERPGEGPACSHQCGSCRSATAQTGRGVRPRDLISGWAAQQSGRFAPQVMEDRAPGLMVEQWLGSWSVRSACGIDNPPRPVHDQRLSNTTARPNTTAPPEHDRGRPSVEGRPRRQAPGDGEPSSGGQGTIIRQPREP